MTSECIYIGSRYLGLHIYWLEVSWAVKGLYGMKPARWVCSFNRGSFAFIFLLIGTFSPASLLYIQHPLCIVMSRRLYYISTVWCWLAFSCYYLILWLTVTASEKLVEEAFNFEKICDDWIERFACISDCWKFWWRRFKYLRKNKYFCSLVQILIGIGPLFVFNKVT